MTNDHGAASALAVGVNGCGDEDAFVCPCHWGRYTHTGAVLGGPAPEPLERLPVEVRGGQVYAVRT